MPSLRTRFTPVATAGARPMGSLHHIDVEVSVKKDAAPDRCHPDGTVLNGEMVDRLGHQTMDGAVMTAGAEMGLHILQREGAVEYFCHARGHVHASQYLQI